MKKNRNSYIIYEENFQAKRSYWFEMEENTRNEVNYGTVTLSYHYFNCCIIEKAYVSPFIWHTFVFCIKGKKAQLKKILLP